LKVRKENRIKNEVVFFIYDLKKNLFFYLFKQLVTFFQIINKSFSIVRIVFFFEKQNRHYLLSGLSQTTVNGGIENRKIKL